MDTRQNLHRLVTAALFAAAITVVTAYLLHIPIPTGGYIHLGDTLIYLAACLLPVPYAAAAAAIICSQFTWFLAQPRETNAT